MAAHYEGKYQVTARRVDFIITKREAAADSGDDEPLPF